MSGGSFNYLCFCGPGEVLQRPELDEMAAELRALGHDAKDVAARTEKLIALRASIESEIEALAPVWQAVEWWRSCDWTRDDVFIALGVYRERERQKAARS